MDVLRARDAARAGVHRVALGTRWIPNVHAKAESVRGGMFDLLKIKPLRDTLIASGIVSAAWDVYQFFMPIYGRSLEPLGHRDRRRS